MRLRQSAGGRSAPDEGTTITFKPLRSEALYLGIVEEISRSVMNGELKPGDQLPIENEMARQFGVSRTVVREAIKALTMQGIVDVSPGRGTFISRPGIERIISNFQIMLKLEDHSYDDLIYARRLLEVPIAGLAADKAESSHIEALREYLEGMRKSIDDPESFIYYDTAFHAELAHATKNAVLMILIGPIIRMMQASREILSRVPGVSLRAYDFHERLYQAVVDKDVDGAERIMDAHLGQVSEDVLQARRAGVLEETR